MVIERDLAQLGWIHEQYPDVSTVAGDATLDMRLHEAGITKAKGLLCCLGVDTDNVFVCLSARDLNSQLTIVARALEEGSTDKLFRAGANHVVSPNISGAIRMTSMLLRPEMVSFLDIVARQPGSGHEVGNRGRNDRLGETRPGGSTQGVRGNLTASPASSGTYIIA